MKKIRLRTPISILVFTLLGFQSQFSYATECPEGKVLGAHTKGCIPNSGICGNNCSYTIDEKGNLNIFPTDNTKPAGYDSRGRASELYMSQNIVNVNIAEGITSLAYDSFAICNNIESMKLPKSLEHIGGCTFQFGGKLAAVIIPPNVKTFASDARNSRIKYYCSENTISQCGSSGVKYKLTDDELYIIYDNDDKIKGVYTDLDSILNDKPVESYYAKNKNGEVIAKYDGRGNQIGSYKYDIGGNLIGAYENGKLVYSKTIYTSSEATQAIKPNGNTVSITW